MNATLLAQLLMQHPDAEVYVQISDECACPITLSELFLDRERGQVIVLQIHEGDWVFTPALKEIL
jgi:hypothetical protein